MLTIFFLQEISNVFCIFTKNLALRGQCIVLKRDLGLGEELDNKKDRNYRSFEKIWLTFL